MVLRAEDVVHSQADVIRPLLHHLNNDNTWLLQIPRANGPRLFYNILIDPWLAGPDINFYKFFHEQHHGEESAAKTIAEVEQFLGDIEKLARHYRPSGSDRPDPISWIDVISVSIYGGDHCNEDTLKQVSPSVPVFAYDPAAIKQIKSWKHFTTVVQTPRFRGNWRDVQMAPLPDNISISMLQSSWDWNNLHFGLVVAYQCPRLDTTEDVEYMEAQCIYHTPHGTPAADMSPLAMADPPLQVTALLHGCLRVTVGWGKASFVANMGAHNGLEVSRLLKSKHWLQTHDEHKVEKGLTKWTLTHDWQSVDDAAALCADACGEDKDSILKQANFRDLGNGGSLILA